MDVRKFKRPESKGTSAKGVETPDMDLSAKGVDTPDNNQDKGTADYKPSEETNQDVIQDYLKYLEKEEIDKEDIFSVLDSIITTGNVYWTFKLFDRIPVTFKIRPAWVNDLLVRKMDRDQPRTFNRFSEMVGMHNLCGSLVDYNGNKFNLETEEDFEKIMEFVKNLPFIIQGHLIKKMAVFDRVVAVATSDWAAQNFTEPQSGE